MGTFLRELRARTIVPVILLISIFVIGTSGYMIIGKGEWTLLNCAFMTAITLSTVGYGDILHIEASPAAMIYTIILMLVGMGIVLYSVSVITAFLVEEGFSILFLEHRMLKKMKKLNNHYIVAGAGSLGENVVREFQANGVDFVAIDQGEDVLEQLAEELTDLNYIIADAMQDNVLLNAGIEHAAGLVACLPSDQENLYLTVTAKLLNPNMRVVARAHTEDGGAKLLRVGADRVVSSDQIGGLRLASEILRPDVVTFLERMLRDKDHSTRISQITIGSDSALNNLALSDSKISEKFGLLVLAVLPSGKEDFIYAPPHSLTISSGMVLVVLGEMAGVRGLEQLAN